MNQLMWNLGGRRIAAWRLWPRKWHSSGRIGINGTKHRHGCFPNTWWRPSHKSTIDRWWHYQRSLPPRCTNRRRYDTTTDTQRCHWWNSRCHLLLRANRRRATQHSTSTLQDQGIFQQIVQETMHETIDDPGLLHQPWAELSIPPRPMMPTIITDVDLEQHMDQFTLYKFVCIKNCGFPHGWCIVHVPLPVSLLIVYLSRFWICFASLHVCDVHVCNVCIKYVYKIINKITHLLFLLFIPIYIVYNESYSVRFPKKIIPMYHFIAISIHAISRRYQRGPANIEILMSRLYLFYP